MVLTHKTVSEQKKKKIHVKEYDPARKYMSKEEAVEKNRQLKEDHLKIDQYAEQLKKEREVPAPAPEQPVVPEIPSDVDVQIASLELQLESTKGPGSKAKKEKIREQIEALKS